MKQYPQMRIEKCRLGNRNSGFYDCFFVDYLDGKCWVNLRSARTYDEALSMMAKNKGRGKDGIT